MAYLSNLISGQRGGTVKHVRSDTIEVAFGRIGELAQRVVTPRAILDVELRPGVIGGSAFRFRPLRYNYGDEAFENGRRFSREPRPINAPRAAAVRAEVDERAAEREGSGGAAGVFEPSGPVATRRRRECRRKGRWRAAVST